MSARSTLSGDCPRFGTGLDTRMDLLAALKEPCCCHSVLRPGWSSVPQCSPLSQWMTVKIRASGRLTGCSCSHNNTDMNTQTSQTGALLSGCLCSVAPGWIVPEWMEKCNCRWQSQLQLLRRILSHKSLCKVPGTAAFVRSRAGAYHAPHVSVQPSRWLRRNLTQASEM